MRSPRVRRISLTRSCPIYCYHLRSIIGFLRPTPDSPMVTALYRISVCHNLCHVISFLQIPPHDGHPCLDSRFRSTRFAADFHRLKLRHAWRHVDSLDYSSEPLLRTGRADFPHPAPDSTMNNARSFGELRTLILF